VPSTLARIALFLSSYAPLFVILGLRQWSSNLLLAQLALSTALISVITLFVFLRLARSISTVRLSVSRVRTRDGDVAAYVVTYLIPFLDASFDEPAKAAGLVVLLGVILVLYVYTNLIYMNPLLLLAGYHVFEVETEGGRIVTLVAKQTRIPTGRHTAAASIGDDLFLALAAL
jgi:hypothetical protein